MEQQSTQPERSASRPRSGAETAVRQVLDDFTASIRDGDIDEIMSFYAPDLVAFDMMPPLAFRDKDLYRENWAVFFTDYFKFPVTVERAEELIVADGDAAFRHCLIHMSGDSHEGKRMETWMRNTTCLRRIGGEWRITHEHNSVPLDMETGKGLMDLQPGRS